jgi:hypothetical protein
MAKTAPNQDDNWINIKNVVYAYTDIKINA